MRYEGETHLLRLYYVDAPEVSARAEKRRELAEIKDVQASVMPAMEKIDINVAGLDALQILPGVGPVTAGNIITNRPYATPEDLLRVPRITKKTLENLLPMLKELDAASD